MKEVSLPVLENSDCQTKLRKTPNLGRFFRLHKSFLCAGGEEGIDACKGDGGSPLVCPIEGDSDGRVVQVMMINLGQVHVYPKAPTAGQVTSCS